jgi:hypothetical protein
MNKLFKIIETNVHKEEIEVFLQKGEDEKGLFIPRQAFEDWLIRTDRLEKCDDYVIAGEHEQHVFKVPIDQYYLDFSNERIESDLYDYIVINYTDPFYIKPALNNILQNAFSHV